jgi:Biotin-lipoyl like/HlyD family secretion protein
VSATFSSLPEVERLARAAQKLPALAFSMANDAWGLLGYRQALVMRKSAGRWGAQAISGLVEAGETTPYQNWLRRLAVHLEMTLSLPVLESPDAEPTDTALLQLTPEDLPPELAQEWSEWWPAEVIYLFLRARPEGSDARGAMNGLAFYLFDAPVNQTRLASLERLAEVWQHAWAMLSGAARKSWLPSVRTRWIIAAVLLAALLIPVRQSVLAPAEIISLESVVLASPQEGVVREVLVRPNQAVTADQPLVALDDTTLRNRREVLLKSVGSAQAELLATTQKSFDNIQSRGDIAPLSGRVEERRAELAYIDEQLQRMVLTSPKAGITVYGDPNDWQGRPVAAGERVMLIANPAKLGVLIHVPVGDAIAVDAGAPVRLFLHVSPLSPLDAEVIETGYQALLSPDNVASYRVRAKLTAGAESSRIGLKGTAKLYGTRVVLGYWLLRRPMAAAREWVGI